MLDPRAVFGGTAMVLLPLFREKPEKGRRSTAVWGADRRPYPLGSLTRKSGLFCCRRTPPFTNGGEDQSVSSPSATPPVKATHSLGRNVSTAPFGSWLSRTWTRPLCSRASTQLSPPLEWLDFCHVLFSISLLSPCFVGRFRPTL